MAYNSTVNYVNLVHQLADQRYHVPDHIKSSFMGYAKSVFQSDVENRYSEPMVWIGVYIALASLCCILAMVADLVHGLRSRKLYVPCKYFAINSASLTVIAVAMKLPVDLTSPMPGVVDQLARLGSMAFMCTMMANLLPSLATMNNDALLANVVALGVMVITLVVNVCIQIKTGVVVSRGGEATKLLQMISTGDYIPDDVMVSNKVAGFKLIAIVYSALLLLLLIIYVYSYVVGTSANQIFEHHYHARATRDIRPSTSTPMCSTVQELEPHVTKYWIMLGSFSPQYLYSFSVTTPASVVISAFVTILHTLSLNWAIADIMGGDYDSDYKWTTLLILIIQFIGVTLSTVAPLFRCIASLRFFNNILDHIKVFKVDRFWTEKLYDWKYGSISLPFHSPKLKIIIMNMKLLILNFCIKVLDGVVVVLKIIRLQFLLMVFVLRCLKWLLQHVFNSSGEYQEDAMYVSQLADGRELAERRLKALSNSFKQFILKCEKKQPENLLKLINKKPIIDFQGVKAFDNGDHRTCWSLEVVTLTTIAVTLANFEKVEVESWCESVREGLEYVTLVEKYLYSTDDTTKDYEDYARLQLQKKAAERLWQEVDVFHTWLGIRLKDISSQSNTAPQIVQLFLEKAENQINKEMKGPDVNFRSICAESMSSVTKTIRGDMESHERLFNELSKMIADIMAACLTNLPQVIAMKCHASVIEKREASVQSAAKLLGETKEVIKTIQDKSCDYIGMNPEDLPYIHKWRAFFKRSMIP